MKEKAYIKERMADTREPRQSDWYNLIESYGDFFVKDSTEETDFDSDEIVLVSAALEGFLGATTPTEITEALEESVDDLENLVDGYEEVSGEYYYDGNILNAEAIAYVAELYIDPAVEEALRYFTDHIEYVDYVTADGGSVVSLTGTLNFYKEII